MTLNREHVFAINRLRLVNGFFPQPEETTAKGNRVPRRQTNVQLSLDALFGLEQLAYEIGYSRGAKGNVSRLLEAIGQGLFELRINPELFDTDSVAQD